MTQKKPPNLEDIQKEFEEFVHKRFGGQVHIITHTQNMDQKTKKEQEKPVTKPLVFDEKPKTLKAYLDQSVIGQDEAKKALSIAICDHYNHMMWNEKNPDVDFQYAKQNILLMGPTGVGKTYMIKEIAKKIGVPFVKADATKFSETGYVGANVEDLIKDLVKEAQGDLKLAQYGIVYLDEGDKLATQAGFIGKDVNGRGVQTSLLKLMEETDIDLKADMDPASQLQAFMHMQQKGHMDRQVISTKYILFIISGAFHGIEHVIEKRLNQKTIGIRSSLSGQEEMKRTILLKEVHTEDFIQYGFEPEFVGRLPVRVVCDPLDQDALYHILKDSKGSILRQYEKAFEAYGISLTFEDDALKSIAKKALKEKIGARALMSVCEKVFRDYKFELPSTDLTQLHVDASMVEKPAEKLKKLLAECGPNYTKEIQKIRQFEEDFEILYQMKISFDKDALLLVIDRSVKECLSLEKVCEHILQGYEHGLKLIEQNTGQNSFSLTKDCVLNPRAALERMISQSYGLKNETSDSK